MKFFVKPVEPTSARSDYAQKGAVLLAAIITILLVMQLFTFDEFISLADTFSLPGFSGVGFASLVIVLELLALPFLLRMAASPAFRWLSAASLVGIMALWLYSSVVVVVFRDVASVGFSGGLGTLTPGWWAPLFIGALSVLSVWALWGLWPGVKKNNDKK